MSKTLFTPAPVYDLQPGLLSPQLNPTDKVRALSWKQPFASLMLHGKIETRIWDTKVRGLVLICASAKGYTTTQMLGISGKTQTERALNTLYLNGDKEPLAQAIAIGELVDSRPMRPEEEEATMVKYYPDLFCHVYANVKAIKPIPWKGKQGWSTLTQDIINQIEIL